MPLPAQAFQAAMYPTPTAADSHRGSETMMRGNLTLLGAARSALWPTPCVPNGGRSPKAGMSVTGVTPEGTKRQVDLQEVCRQVTSALWPTPTAQDSEQAGGKGCISRGNRGHTLNSLATALWPTATAVDGARGLTTRPQDTGIPLPQRVGQVLGMGLAGSLATTAKRGVLNPAFPCWLMGYPLAHLFCGATAMQSLSRSRRKSSAR